LLTIYKIGSWVWTVPVSACIIMPLSGENHLNINQMILNDFKYGSIKKGK